MYFSVFLLGILMVVSYVLSLLGFLEIGIIIDDHYVFASREKRKTMNKKPYYRQSAIVFLCLGTMFLLYILRILSGVVYFAYLSFAICGIAMIYAIASHYTIRRKASQKR